MSIKQLLSKEVDELVEIKRAHDESQDQMYLWNYACNIENQEQKIYHIEYTYYKPSYCSDEGHEIILDSMTMVDVLKLNKEQLNFFQLTRS